MKRHNSELQLHIEGEENWLYNIRNDRLIASKQDLEPYLDTVEELSNPLNEFYSSPRKRRNLLNIHILRLTLDSIKIKKFHKLTLLVNKWYFTLFFIFFSLLFLNKIGPFIPLLKSDFSVSNVVWSYVIVSVVILPLHEYAHFSVYYNYFKPDRVTFGFSLRYFSMLVFFTKVPFYPLMKKKEKIILILAGIRMQILIWFILTVLMLIHPTLLVSELTILNISIILINLLPFLKLDGYWLICELLDVDDYMTYFRKMFSKKKSFKVNIFLMGITNFIVIISVISYTFVKILYFFIK